VSDFSRRAKQGDSLLDDRSVRVYHHDFPGYSRLSVRAEEVVLKRDYDALLVEAQQVARGALEAAQAAVVAEAQVLRLAQALRLLRDTTAPGGYVENVCIRALAEACVPDPPDEEHP
jgi:hypothetical protein